METRSAKRKKLFTKETNNDGTDRISHLSDEILHEILFLLPIKSIAQTSLLSKRFKSIWSSFPDLDFTTVENASTVSSRKRQNLDFINHVLSLRRDKESHIRTLRCRARLSFSNLNSLFRHAIKYNVQNFFIDVATKGFFNLPRCIVTSESLRVFEFKSYLYGFRLPPSSIMTSGFKTIHTLSLSNVALYGRSNVLDLFTEFSFPMLRILVLNECACLENLKICCRGLEEIKLDHCYQLVGLEISGLKLKRLRVANCFKVNSHKSWVKIIDSPKLTTIQWISNSITDTSCVENLRSLREATIGFYLIDERLSEKNLHSVAYFFNGISHAHSLTLNCNSLEILSKRNNLKDLLHPFHNLKHLELHTKFTKTDVKGVSWLLRNSVSLHTLYITIDGDHKEMKQDDEQYWESQTRNLAQFLDNITMVKIDGFMEHGNEVSLAKLLLKHGTVLREMSISSGNRYRKSMVSRAKLSSYMKGFEWASSNAKIVFH